MTATRKSIGHCVKYQLSVGYTVPQKLFINNIIYFALIYLSDFDFDTKFKKLKNKICESYVHNLKYVNILKYFLTL